MSGISSQFEFGSCLDYGSRATVGVGYGPAEDGLRARYAPASGGLYYLFLWDPQGSVQQRHTDDSYTGGYAAYDRSAFEGYGALRQANKGSTGAIVGQHDPAGFGGQFGYYTDTETGLLCLTHRYYDPGTGKFINRDPIGYGGGANLYGFADGNPINEDDPDGTAPVGHHYVPQSIFRRAGLPANVVSFFDRVVTGPVPGGHNYTGHGIYNRAVKSMWDDWLAARKINPAQMSVSEAREFVTMVRTSNNSNIRTLLDGITYQFVRLAATRAGVASQISRGISATKPLRGIGINFGRIMKFIPKVPGPLMIFDMIPGWMYNGNYIQAGNWERTHPGQKYHEYNYTSGGC